MIQSREEILVRIYSTPKLQQLFESWTVLQQKEFLDFCSGAKGIKVTVRLLLQRGHEPGVRSLQTGVLSVRIAAA